MKTLILIRHAKSSWGDMSLPDRDRPLEARGERDAAKMGKRLSKRRAQPDLIVSSPALRTLETAKLIAKEFDDRAGRVVVDERIYAASAQALIAVVEALDDSLDCVALVGHNPGFTELAHRFSSAIAHMPTCAIAEFGFESDTWTGIGQARPSRTDFDSPKRPSGLG